MEENDLRYKIMHESTMGWSLYDREAQNLTKEEREHLRFLGK